MLGEVSKRYKLLQELGRGGMGVVYKAQDRLQNQIVALKQVTIASESLQFAQRQNGELESKPSVALAHEFRTLASLRHPHIISVLDYGFDELHRPFFTMEYLENSQPFHLASQDLPLEKRLELTIQMLHALVYLHRRNLIHRDLKPENVLVVEEDNKLQVKVLDFGVANEVHTGGEYDEIVGTLAYIAPEIFQGMSSSIASDLYAVGVMLYELFHGKHPFEARFASDLLQMVLSVIPKIDVNSLHPELASSIARLLHKDPAERYEDAQELIEVYANMINRADLAENNSIRESFLQAAKFVGRDEELALLKSALKVIFTDDPLGSAWLIGGESGVGKSRLSEELRTIALVEGALVLKGEGVAGGGLPYQLWRDVARRLVLATDDISDIEASVLQEIVPDIASLIGREVRKPETLTGMASVERLSLTLLDLLSRQAKPVVLILSDLHWMSTSLLVLQKLLKSVKTLPLLIIASYRNDERADLAETLSDMRLITLKRLSLDAIEKLSNAMLGKDTTRDVVTFIQQHSEGNAFFIIEIVRALADHAGQFSDIGHLTLPQSIITGGIDLIIQRRLALVGADYEQALKVAAIAGRIVDPKILKQALGDDYKSDFLQRCSDASVLEIHAEKWRFTHNKLREFLLTALSEQEKIALNKQVAEAIETVYPDDVARAHILSLHYLAAKNKQKATYYGLMAAKQMANTSTYQEAVTLLQDVLRLLGDDANFAEKLMEIYVALGRYYENLSLYDNSLSYFLQGLDLARASKNDYYTAFSLNGLGVIAYNQSEFDKAEVYLNESLDIARRVDASEIIAMSLKHRSNIYSVEGAYQKSDGDLQEALSLNRAGNFQVESAGCLNNLGVNAYMRGDYAEAKRYYSQALDLYQKIGYRTGIALCESNLGDVSYDDGHEVQLAHYQRGLKIYREVNNQWGVALCLDNMASTLITMKRFEQAYDALQESISISRVIGDQYSVMYSYGNLGLLYYVQAKYQQSIDACQESLKLAEDIDETDVIANVYTQLAVSQVKAGLLDEAQVNLKRACELAEGSEAKPNFLSVLLGIVYLYQAQNKQDEVQTLVLFLASQTELEDTLRRIYLQPLTDAIQLDNPSEQLLADIWQAHRL